MVMSCWGQLGFCDHEYSSGHDLEFHALPGVTVVQTKGEEPRMHVSRETLARAHRLIKLVQSYTTNEREHVTARWDGPGQLTALL